MTSIRRRVSRRALLRGALAGGSGLLAAYVIGCAEGDGRRPTPAATRLPAPTMEPGKTPAPTETAPAGMRWRQLVSDFEPPSPRRDHSLVRDGEQLYVFGGRSPDPLDDLWTFDLSTDTWTQFTAVDGPAARFGHNAVFDAERGRMVLFGGQAGGTFFNDAWAFDVAGGRWTQLSAGESGPSPRYGAAGALDPAGRFLVSHGFTDAGRFDDTWGYDLGGGAWAEASPQGERPLERCLMRAVWDDGAGRLLMFGGQSTGIPFLGDLWQLRQDGWRELAAEPKPSPRNFYAMVFDDEGGRLVLFGGSTESGPADDLWLFDSTTNSWSERSPEGEAPAARFGHDAVWMPGSRSLLMFGGSDGSQDLNDLWELTPPA